MTWLVVTWSAVAALFTAVTCWRVVRSRAAQATSLSGTRVLVLRPVDAPTEAELRNLSQPLPSGTRQVVLSPTQLPGVAAEQWFRSNPSAINRKVGHLVAGLAHRQADEIVVAADADVVVTEGLLASLTAPVRRGASVCWAAPVPREARGFGGRALRGLLARSQHAFRALDSMRVGPPTMCGKAVAYGEGALVELQQLGTHIGEDLELSVRMHRKGQLVVLADAAAVTLPAASTFEAARARLTRWMLVLRSHRPALFPSVPLFFTPTIPLLVLAALTFDLRAALATSVLLAVRTALAVLLFGAAGAWEWLLGEWLLLSAFVSSLGRSEIDWRGRRLRVEQGGVARVAS